MRMIELAHNWTAEYFEPSVDTFEFAPSPQQIENIVQWRFSPRFAQAQYFAWLQRYFTLIPVEPCASFELVVEGDYAAQIYLNDALVVDKQTYRVQLDVTHDVFLGENRLNIRIDSLYADAGTFTAIQLIETSCGL